MLLAFFYQGGYQWQSSLQAIGNGFTIFFLISTQQADDAARLFLGFLHCLVLAWCLSNRGQECRILYPMKNGIFMSGQNYSSLSFLLSSIFCVFLVFLLQYGIFSVFGDLSIWLLFFRCMFYGFGRKLALIICSPSVQCVRYVRCVS